MLHVEALDQSHFELVFKFRFTRLLNAILVVSKAVSLSTLSHKV